MSIENKNLNEQENLSPFNIEKVEEIKLPNVEIKDGKLLIDGVVQEKYNYVDDESFQKNNSDLLYFNASVGENESKNRAGRIIDIKNPEKELVVVNEDKDKNILVNGNKWDSLRGKNVYWGGYRVEFDPEGKKIVFWSSEGDETRRGGDAYSVVVNNQVWNTKFDSISEASSKGGIAYAFGGSQSKNKFAVEDKEWKYNHFKNEKYAGGGLDEIRNVKVTKNGNVVAVIDSLRQNDDIRRYISVGDKVGEKLVWKNTFAPASHERPNIIAVDDENNHIAVFGQNERDGKTELLIDDMPYEISGNPKKLDYMDFKDGSLVIQYDNALSEKITEKISIREDSKEVQEMKERKEAEEKVFEDLRNLLVKENIPANEIVARLKKGDDLEKEKEKNKILNSNASSFEGEKIKLQTQLEQSEKTHKEEIRNLEVKLTNAEMALKKLENILKGAGKVTMSSNFKLSPEDMKLALDSIQKALEK